MRRLALDRSWPDGWVKAFDYDSKELWGDFSVLESRYSYQNRYGRVMAAIQTLVKPPARILDFAGAQGNFAIGFAELGYDVVWNDLRDDLVGYVKLKDETGRISYQPGNLFEFPETEQFDVVFAGEVIEHVAHPDQLLAKLRSVVKPDGAIVITTPNGAYFRNTLPRFSECPDPSVFESVQFKPDADGHIFLLHPDEIRDLAARAGFTVERLELFNNPLTSGHVKLGYVLPIIPQWLVEAAEAGSQRLPKTLHAKLHTLALAVMRPRSRGIP